MNKFFLICPECYVEHAIRNAYGRDCFFLTALGAVFHFDNHEYSEELKQFLARENIGCIYIVNDFSCTFIQNALNGKIGDDMKTETILLRLAKDNTFIIRRERSKNDRAIKLAELNIRRQACELTDSSVLGDEASKKRMLIKGLIYNRYNEIFSEIGVGA